MSTSTSTTDEATPQRKRRSFSFPSAVTTLALVTILVWLAALVIPAGQYDRDEDGAPVAGSFQEVDSPLTFGERVRELILSPVNGFYGVQDLDTGVVNTENVGALFGSIGVVVFIFALGAFLSVSFATKSLEVAVARLAGSLQSRGWLLIVAIMVLFSALGSTMGFSVETFGFYGLLIPLMAALGYDRMTTAAMIILGALTGAMASTVNPFSIGVASGEAGVSLGDGIGLRLVLWVLLTALAVLWVLRYAAMVKRDPSKSLVGMEPPPEAAGESVSHESDVSPDTPLSMRQRWVLVVTGLTFGLLIFSVIPWSSIIGATTDPADDLLVHETATENFGWELGWWFPELAMLFVLAALVIGMIARMGEAEFVRLFQRGIGDMVGPALVIVLARGVAVIMNNTQTLDTVLNAMERAVSGTSTGVFAVLVAIVNIPLAFLIPSSSGHATLAMPLLAPLSDFAGVARSLTITAFQMGHGWTLLWAPTNVVVVAGLALAKVRYDQYLRFVWPFLLASFVLFVVVLLLSAAIG